MSTFLPLPACCIAVLCCLLVTGLPDAAAGPPAVSFRRDIAPVLRDQCLACHGEKKSEGDYRVDSFEWLMKPGASGDPPVAAGKPDESELLRRLESDDESDRMPLEAEPLPPAVVARFRRWIAEGARCDAPDPTAPIVTVVAPADYPPAPPSYARAVPVMALTWARHADQPVLVTGGYRELLVWHAENGTLLRRIGNLPPRIHALAVRPDGKQLAVAGGEPGRVGELRLLEFESGELTGVPLIRGDVVVSVVYDREGKRLVAGASDGSVSVVDVDSGRRVWSIEAHKEWAKSVAWSPDGQWVVSGGFDNQVKVLAAADGTQRVVFGEHKQPVWSVAVAADGESAFSGDETGRVLRWSLQDGKKTAEVRVGGAAHQMLVTKKCLFVASSARRVSQLDPRSNQIAKQWTGPKGRVISVTWDESSQRLAAGTDQGEVWVWSLESGKKVAQWENRGTGNQNGAQP